MSGFKHGVSIVAILKDEESYVQEWIEFHKKSGVSHFYLYDNSDDNVLGGGSEDICG